MSRDLVQEALWRLGYNKMVSAQLPPGRTVFDETEFLRRLPIRLPDAVQIGPDARVADWGGKVHAKGLRVHRYETVDDPIEALLSSSVAFACVSHEEHLRPVVEALAAGCVVVADLDLAVGRMADFVLRAPVNVWAPWAHQSRSVSADLAANLVAACAMDWQTNGRTYCEASRRWVTMLYSASTAAIDLASAVGAFDTDRFTRLSKDRSAVSDSYMWPDERRLLAAVASTLRVDGVVVEVGVGNGGTLATLAEFGSGRAVYGVDNFSYGREEQRAAVAAATGGYPIELVIGDSAAVDPPAGPYALCHVDGDHDEGPTLVDLRRFGSSVCVGGVLAVDDYGTRLDQPGVASAVHTFLEESGRVWTPIAAGPKLALWRRVA